MSGLRIGLAQIAPTLGDVHRNFSKHLEMVSRAREKGVGLLVFPELSLTGYFLADLVADVAMPVDGGCLRELVHSAGDMSLVVGFVEQSSDYRYFISSAYFEAGQLLHIHRKVYLPTYGMFEDLRYFASGDRIRAFDTRYGRQAVLICEDMWHPSTAYIASEDGANFLISVNASPGRGISTSGTRLGTSRAVEELNRVYAQFFTTFVVFCNRVGTEDGISFWGGSEIVTPGGKIVAKAPYFDEALVVGEVELAELRRERISLPLRRDERLDITLRELERIQRERAARAY